MKRFSLFTAVLLAVSAGTTHAANFAVITNPPTILNICILFGSVGAAFGCVKVYELVRGGSFSKSWQLFLLGFGMLALGQIVLLLHTFEVLIIPEFVVPSIWLLMAGLFTYGVFEIKKVLS